MKHFAISLTGTYTRDEIPPRCRKPRPVTYETSAQVEVPTVSSDDAPVAFRIREVEDRIKEIRTFDGRLFAPYLPHSHQEEPSLPGSVHFPQDVDVTRHHRIPNRAESEDEFHQTIEAFFGGFLIIDGVVWAESREPAYEVVTFGLGGDGSTALMATDRATQGNVFRADEFEAARAFAEDVARQRGDRQERFEDPRSAEWDRAIEVLIPEAVTLVTATPAPKDIRDLRFNYSLARDRLSRASTPDDEKEHFSEAVRLRDEIIMRGYSPIESEVHPYEARHEAKERL